jgi:predicted amidohydrolase
VIVFHELSLTGYDLDFDNDLAFTGGDLRLRPLLELASSRNMILLVGAPVRIGATLYIGAFIVFPDRSVDLYTKHRLGAFPPDVSPDGVVPPAEATVFQAGSLNPLVRFDGHTAAVAVCADIGRPSHPREAANRGAKTYLASMFVIPQDLERDTARLSSYAAQYSMAVVFANYGGPSGGLPAGGCSAIWSESGELLVRLEATGWGLVVAAESESGWCSKAISL